MCKVEKILNTLINNSIFIELKNNFLLNTNIKNFKLLIIFFKEYISDTIGKFKYSLNYNLNLSITNAIGEPIFFNYLNFTTLNIFTNSFNNIYNNEINLLSLFNLYVNKLNNFSLVEQIIVNKTISKKNKKWTKINNFYLRYGLDGIVTTSYYNSTISYVNCIEIYNFNNTSNNFPYIPSKYTSISCDFYGNFYIFDKIQTNPYLINILYFNKDPTTIKPYIWGKINLSDISNNNIVYGCTGLFTSIKKVDGTPYYGFFCNTIKDPNYGSQFISYYINNPILNDGDKASLTNTNTSQIPYPYLDTYTGTDIGIYSNSNTNPNTACIAAGANYLNCHTIVLKNNFDESYKLLSVNGKAPEYWGSASICFRFELSNSKILVYQSYGGQVYYTNYDTLTSTLAIDINGKSILPSGYYATGITSHTDNMHNSFLYIAYHDINNINYIYKYVLSSSDGSLPANQSEKTNGSLNLVSYITGGYNGELFYNIGYMTGGMAITYPDNNLPYTIYCYEYSTNYNISRIIAVSF